MAAQKSWFGIEIVLAVVLIAASLAVAALVPMVECPSCQGSGTFFYGRMGIECPQCRTRKKVTLMSKWFRDVSTPSRSAR